MKKILVIFGTRPEAIKMAPVVAELKKKPRLFEVRICVTGQHREMLDQVLKFFDIMPDYDLNLMKFSQDLTDITQGVLIGVRDILRSWVPDKILVHGDTTTAFSASLAGFYEKISVAHIEAGLRTDNIYSPWPEEMNRRLVSVIASEHFAPTKQAKKNLICEGKFANSIFVTGNTVVDALLDAVAKIQENSVLQTAFHDLFPFLDEKLKLIIVTGHRRENFGEGFEQLCLALKTLSERDDVQILYPVHPNPKVQEPVYKMLGKCSRIHLVEPQDYLPFVYLMKRSFMIITDSGGIQEEAPTLGKPVIVARDTTERPEAVAAGTVKLVGANTENIVRETELLLDSPAAYDQMSGAYNPYGDGKAAKRITEILSKEMRGYT